MDRVCPLLALAADRRTAVDGVEAGHRCHALESPVPLERERQSQLCLTTAHQRCERYLAQLGRTGRPPGTQLPIGDGLRSTRLLLTPEPTWRGIAGRARRSPRGVAVALIAVVALGGGTAVAAGLARAPRAAEVASPSPLPAAQATATPQATPTAVTVTPSPAPATTPTPVLPAPTPAPTPVPATPAPTSQPTAQRTYVVQAGDTLAFIAQQFGVSVPAIQAANGIEDANEIIIGQVLVIP